MKYFIGAICSILLFGCQKEGKPPSEIPPRDSQEDLFIKYQKQVDSMYNGYGSLCVVDGDTVFIISDSR